MKCTIILMGLQRFDEGTQPTPLGKPKFVTLADALCSRAPQAIKGAQMTSGLTININTV